MDASTQTAAPNNEPSNPPFIRSGHLAAPGFSEHRIYWEEYGSLTGEPVIVMHGGPGAGSHTSSARFFNPQRYRVVLFDQRGCGKSTPSASDDDATPALTDNTTQHLIDDVSATPWTFTGLFAFQPPRVKSGTSMLFPFFATDISLKGVTELHAAASYTS